MKKLIIFLSLASLLSCKDFLNIRPSGYVTVYTLATPDGIQQLLIGAYSLLDGQGAAQGFDQGARSAASNWVYGDVCADNSYKGSTPSDQSDIVLLETWNALPNNPYLSAKWRVMYEGVQRSNDVIRTVRIAENLTNQIDTNEVIAEARFLRGFYHFELYKIFKNIPYVDESVSYGNGNYDVPNVDQSGNYINPLPKIEADFLFAYQHLPAKQPEPGRVNKYAAGAFLAWCYLYELKYSDAKTLLDDIIQNGTNSKGQPYALQPIFANNFNPDPSAKNSTETVFAVQMSVNDGFNNDVFYGQGGYSNGNFGDLLNFPYTAGPGGCCGFNNPSQDLANSYKTDNDGLPLFSNNAFQTGNNVSDTLNPWTGHLDPRIDWTMGRNGIPYLDWGPASLTWVRDIANDGFFVPKKNVYAKSQQGTYSDNSNFWGSAELTANNVNIIRFSQILLWTAECEAELGNLQKAQEYVDIVRSRVSNPAGWVYKNASFDAKSFTYTPQNTPADNYKVSTYTSVHGPNYFNTIGKKAAIEAIRFEERLEFAMEGHRFFDLQRWNNEDPGYMAGVLNNYAVLTKIRVPYFNGATFTQGKSEIFPIPQSQIDIENKSGKINLKQNPGY
jgi:hypothetical protein